MTEASPKIPAPLELGHGTTELEVFLEPTCPFSKLAFGKLAPLLDRVGHERLTIKIRFVSQPWHLFSGIVTRTILAASATAGGRDLALTAMRAVYDRREEFEFEDHSSGPNMDRTPLRSSRRSPSSSAPTSPRRSATRPSARRSAGTPATPGRTACTSRRPSWSTASSTPTCRAARRSRIGRRRWGFSAAPIPSCWGASPKGEPRRMG